VVMESDSDRELCRWKRDEGIDMIFENAREWYEVCVSVLGKISEGEVKWGSTSLGGKFVVLFMNLPTENPLVIRILNYW